MTSQESRRISVLTLEAQDTLRVLDRLATRPLRRTRAEHPLDPPSCPALQPDVDLPGGLVA